MDILERCGLLDRDAVRKGKDLLARIVAMLARMIERGNQVREDDIVCGYVYVNEYGESNIEHPTPNTQRSAHRR